METLSGAWTETQSHPSTIVNVPVARLSTATPTGPFSSAGSGGWQRTSASPATHQETPVQSYVYGNDDSNLEAYGRLYTWDVSMAGAQGIAPDGWHIPSDEDWNVLLAHLGGASLAGGALKELGTTHWNPPNAGATSSSGFTGLPGGGFSGMVFDGRGVGDHFWSSTQVGANAGLPTLHTSDAAVLWLTARNRWPARFGASGIDTTTACRWVALCSTAITLGGLLSES